MTRKRLVQTQTFCSHGVHQNRNMLLCHTSCKDFSFCCNTLRFFLNTTVGVAGFFDPSKKDFKIEKTNKDFGQTLAVWGWEDSRYLVLPLLGPRTLRDASGFPLDAAAHPITYMDDHQLRAGLTALDIVHLRAGLLDQESLIRGDRYRFIRDAYLQRRESRVRDGKSD